DERPAFPARGGVATDGSPRHAFESIPRKPAHARKEAGGSVSRPRPSIRTMPWYRACHLLLFVTAASAGAAHAAPPDSRDRLVDTIDLRGGDASGQLAVDAATHRLFVPHSTHLTVVDLEKGRQLADVPETRGVRGVALAPALGRGFTSNGAANTITIFGLR